jgi:hypothetical protein
MRPYRVLANHNIFPIPQLFFLGHKEKFQACAAKNRRIQCR